MKFRQHIVFFSGIVLLSILTTCGTGNDDEGFGQFSLEGTDVSIADIAGNWTATKARFSRAAAGPVSEVDVVAAGGSLTLEIQNNGRFSVTVAVPGAGSETSTGRFAFDEDVLVISFDEDPDEWEFFSITHNEPNLTIIGGTVYEAFDFDGDGVDEDSYIDFEFVRSS